MQLYSFTIALRFWHPTIAPEVISSTLGIEPSRHWQAGEARSTPKGTPIDGLRPESYWHAYPLWEGWRESSETEAEDALMQLLPRLLPHTSFIRSIISTGGRGLIHLSSYSAENYAVVLAPEILIQCSDLGLSLAHDVYPTEQA